MGKIGRSSTGRFLVGTKAFAKISSVENVTPSKRLLGDLKKHEHSTPAVRREAVLGRHSEKAR